MKTTLSTMRGSATTLAIGAVAVATLVGGYVYLDNKVDKSANESVEQFVGKMKHDGVNVQYQSVDASPVSSSVTITKMEIKGSETEPDIKLGNIQLSGFTADILNEEQSQKIPKKIRISIDNGTIKLKPNMIAADPNLAIMANNDDNIINFSSGFSYDLDDESGAFKMSYSQSVVENFSIESDFSFGGMTWLTELDPNDPKNLPMAKMMGTSLNNFSITFKNNGLFEKMGDIEMKKSGKSSEEFTQEIIANIEQLRASTEANWGDAFSPMFDELVKFAKNPKELRLSIDPKEPIDNSVFMVAAMGGNAGILEVVKKANIKLKAN